MPFVVKSGGMSLYSTIGEEGIIIDLANFASVAHDKSRHEVVLMGGVTTKVVAVELAKDGHCTSVYRDEGVYSKSHALTVCDSTSVIQPSWSHPIFPRWGQFASCVEAGLRI